MDVDPKQARVDPILRVNPSTGARTGGRGESGGEGAAHARGGGGGRVRLARVVASEGAGRHVIALGGERVAVETSIPLEPGQRLLLRATGQGEASALELIAGGAGGDVERLLAALRGTVGAGRSVGELLASLAATIRSGLAAQGGSQASLSPQLLALLEGLERAGLGAGEGREGMARLLSGAATRYEALLAAALGKGGDGPGIGRLAGNLKARLLAVLGQLEPGGTRDLVSAFLATIETEQLLNLARRSAGEPLLWSFPFADGSDWTTAHLRVSERESEAGEDGDRGSPRTHLVVDVRFSKLGPVRAEFLLDAERLLLQLEVTDEERASRLRAAVPDLLERISIASPTGSRRASRAVDVRVRVVPVEKLSPTPQELDVELLRSHHLLDLEG